MAGSYIGTAPATRDPEVSNDSVGTSKIIDDAVTAAKVAYIDDSLATTSGNIMVADGSDFGNVAMSGDATISSAGAVTIANDAVETVMILDDNVTYAKIQDTVTNNRVLGAATAGAVAEVQVNSDMLAGTIDATKIADGTVTSTEFQYINTLSSNAQTQLDAKPDLTDDQTWSGSQRGTMVTDNDASFDLNGGNNFACTPTGNVTLTFTNHVSGQSGYILMDNAGGHTISLHANTKGDANLASTLSTAGTYLVSYLDNGTNAYLTTSAVFA